MLLSCGHGDVVSAVGMCDEQLDAHEGVAAAGSSAYRSQLRAGSLLSHVQLGARLPVWAFGTGQKAPRLMNSVRAASVTRSS